MRTARSISRFISEDSGAVTVDWVVLTAAIVGLGLVLLNAVGPAADTMTESASDRYANTRITVVGGRGDDDGLGDVVTY